MFEIPTSKCLNGRAVADAIQQEIRAKVSRLPKGRPPPSLHVILVGNDPASDIYVTNKEKTCLKVGFATKAHKIPESTSKKQLEELIQKLNEDPNVHGILLQLPLPKHLDAEYFLNLVDETKDVDGFHPSNVGRLWNNSPRAFAPCTAIGIIRLLEAYNVILKEKHAVVVGQSQIVGKPASALLLNAQSTVTHCHRHSTPLERYTRDADILVVATGVHHLIRRQHIKPGCVVVDVGIHRTENGLQGDVHTEDVTAVADKITPVPGGVGPMTIACLLENTWKAYERITQNTSSR